jgi:hypothetical protein
MFSWFGQFGQTMETGHYYFDEMISSFNLVQNQLQKLSESQQPHQQQCRKKGTWHKKSMKLMCCSSARQSHAFDRRHCGLAHHFKTDPTETVALFCIRKDTLLTSWWQLSSRADQQDIRFVLTNLGSNHVDVSAVSKLVTTILVHE